MDTPILTIFSKGWNFPAKILLSTGKLKKRYQRTQGIGDLPVKTVKLDEKNLYNFCPKFILMAHSCFSFEKSENSTSATPITETKIKISPSKQKIKNSIFGSTIMSVERAFILNYFLKWYTITGKKKLNTSKYL